MQLFRLWNWAPIALAGLALACSDVAEPSDPAETAAEEVDVPTPEEAQRRAAEEIDAENADAELERLKREIDQEQ